MVDVFVTDGHGLPDTTYLSIRIGDARRQAHLRPGSKFRFEKATKPSTFNVDVFEKVGSTQLSMSEFKPGPTGEKEGNATIMRADGAMVRIGLKVANIGSQISGIDSKNLDQTKDAKKHVREKASLKAKSYLEGHGMQNLLQAMVHSLLEKQPDNPIGFMRNYLNDLQNLAQPLQEGEHLDEDNRWNMSPGLGDRETSGFDPDGSMPLPDLSGHHNLSARTLFAHPGIYQQLQNVRTPTGVPLAKCIKTGMDNPGHPMIRTLGAVACDEFCYDTFNEFFTPVITQWHGADVVLKNQQGKNNTCDLSCSQVDPNGGHVVFVHARFVRNLSGVRMPAACSIEERRMAEKELSAALLSLDGEHKGRYLPLRGSKSFAPMPGGMSETEESELQSAHMLLEEPDSSILLASGFGRHWPDARGVFKSDSSGLYAWVNETDHLRLMIRSDDGSIKDVFKQLAQAETVVQATLLDRGYRFAECERLGFVSSCPSQLGTGLTMGAVVKLPLLGAQPKFRDLCKNLGLMALAHVLGRSSIGSRGTFDISAKQRLGITAIQQVNTVIEGTRQLVALEMKLEAGENIDMTIAQPPAVQQETQANDRAGVTICTAGALQEAAQEEEAERSDTELADMDSDDDPEDYDSDEDDSGLGSQDCSGFPADQCPDEAPDLSAHHSMMAKVLKQDPSIYHKLRNLRTSQDVSLARCIKPGVDAPGHQLLRTIGAVAGDAECYDLFRALFDPIILERHKIEPRGRCTDMDPSKVATMTGGQCKSRVLKVRMQLVRNLAELHMLPAILPDERREVERVLVQALLNVGGQFGGEYFPLPDSYSYAPKPGGMDAAMEQKLRSDGVVFEEPDASVSLSGGFGRNWPDARGVFASHDRRLKAWVNEEDHLRMVFANRTHDLKEAFTRICAVYTEVVETVRSCGYSFAESDRLGFVGTCPSHLGTCFTATATVKVPILSEQPQLPKLCQKLGVQAHMCHSEKKERGILDVSNANWLGSSEVDQVNSVIHACEVFTNMEMKLLQGEDIDWDSMPEAIHSAGPTCSQTAETATTPQSAPAKADGQSAEAKETVTTGSTDVVEEHDATTKDEQPLTLEFTDIPGLGAEDYPGFPADVCPDELPNLAKHCSMMAEVLRGDPSVYERLKAKKTPNGITLARCIKPGMDNCGHPMIKTIGAVAGDPECYDTFDLLFDPLIRSVHKKFGAQGMHNEDRAIEKVSTRLMDPSDGHIMSLRITMHRNLAGLRMPPACSKDERREVERVLVRALLDMDGELKGDYYPLQGSASCNMVPGGMSTEDEESLDQNDLLLREPDAAILLSNGTGRHWPDARGVFVTPSKNLAAWINEEDHLVLIALRNGQDVKSALHQLQAAEAAISGSLQQDGQAFSWNSRLGYLSACPSNLGTGMTAEVCAKLPLLEKRPGFKTFCRQLDLKARGTGTKGILGIANLDRLGTSEVDQVNCLIDGLQMLVELEKRLADGKDVDLSKQPFAFKPAPPPETHATLHTIQEEESTAVKALDQDCQEEEGEEEEEEQEEEPPYDDFSNVPGLGNQDMPGFSPDECPEEIPPLKKHYSIMADVLRADPSIYDRLKRNKTLLGVSLARCIKTGMDNCGHPMIKTVGAIAGDAECYRTFSLLFDPIIAAVHPRLPVAGTHQTDRAIERVDDICMDPRGGHVLSVRALVRRNLVEFRMPPACSSDERREVERVLSRGLMELQGKLEGTYMPLRGSTSYLAWPGGMSVSDEGELEEQRLLFRNPDATLVLSTGTGRHWPDARGVFVGSDREVFAWVNEEDHLALAVMHTGQDLKATARNLQAMETAIIDSLQQDGHRFAYDPRLGYLTSWPSNLGTGLTVEVRVKLPLLEKTSGFKNFCRQLRVQPRSSGTSGILDLSNTDRLGTSEVQQVNGVINGVQMLVDLETKLERGEAVNLSEMAPPGH